MASSLVYVETGAKVASTLWAHRSLLSSLLKKAYHAVRFGKTNVAVFGMGGVGKSTFARVLTEREEVESERGEYKESPGLERFKMPNDLWGDLLVPPGQERRHDDTWPDLLRKVSGDSIGIVHVVSWGYHTFELPGGWRAHKLASPGATREEFFEKYLNDRRDAELAVLSKLQPHLEIAEKKIWMITLITKQDLRWKSRQQVDQFYREGPYERAIQAISSKRGSQNFAHAYASASLIYSNLRDGNDEILAETAAGYEQGIRQANLERLCQTLVEFAAPGSSQ